MVSVTKFRNRYRVESARLQGWDYRSAGWYFVTICTKDHVPFFGEVVDGEMVLSSIGSIVADEWQRTPNVRPNVMLDEWMVMPNHLHSIVVLQDRSAEMPRHGRDAPPRRDGPPGRLYGAAGTSRPPPGRLLAGSIGAIVGQVKSVCTKRIWAAGYADFAWQPRFHDHVIRDHESLDRIRQYIANNPAKWEEDRYYIPSPTP
jgi:REP element-mobilizing transposase RayT